jgi:non-homologous end joining protein Ku
MRSAQAAADVVWLRWARNPPFLNPPFLSALAEAIIKQRTGIFDPGTYRDRYQESLRELIEAIQLAVPMEAHPHRGSRRGEFGLDLLKHPRQREGEGEETGQTASGQTRRPATPPRYLPA